MQRKYLGIGLLAGLVASAQACEPPPGFVDAPHPEVAPFEALVSHTEEITIERPFAVLREAAAKTPLRIEIDRTSGLPGVAGTRRLNQGPFQPGARRFVCLTDGSYVVEQVLIFEEKPDMHRHRYVLWNYTSSKFPAISYAVAEIFQSPIDDKRTRVRWTYAFQPDRNRWPGSLGEPGDAMFRDTFVERQFAEWMRRTLAGGKKRAEEAPQ